METVLKIITNHPGPVHAAEGWLRAERGRIICAACNSINLMWYPRPIDIVLTSHPEHRVADGIFFVGVRIFHMDFIEQIRAHLSSFVVGKCFLSDGTLIKEYGTCYTNKRILRRGGRGSVYRECETCGAVYHRSIINPQYTLKAYLTNERVYQDAFSGMYLDEDLAMEIDFSPWPDAQLLPVGVREKPIDGQHLPCDRPHV